MRDYGNKIFHTLVYMADKTLRDLLIVILRSVVRECNSILRKNQ